MRMQVCSWEIRACLLTAGLAIACGGANVDGQDTARPAQTPRSGADLYRAACASCHGPDGRGTRPETSGLDLPLPDFTDCGFASREADQDWLAVVSHGGPARGFDRRMPAFGDALQEADILRILGHVRAFCSSREWPRGELNLPRALRTAKAYPEDEALLTAGVDGTEATSTFVYERRVGPKSQVEIAVPIAVRESGTDRRVGVGDLVLAAKHTLAHSHTRGSIVSTGAEVILPTGDRDAGLGSGTTIVEPFVAFGQVLPGDSFLQLHAGVELPADRSRAGREGFWRAAVGKSVASGRFGRVWSPMLEVTAARPLERGRPVVWDVVPQVQVSLNTRQHVLLNLGVRLPVSARPGRDPQFLAYVLWDWFDGGLFDGW